MLTYLVSPSPLLLIRLCVVLASVPLFATRLSFGTCLHTRPTAWLHGVRCGHGHPPGGKNGKYLQAHRSRASRFTSRIQSQANAKAQQELCFWMMQGHQLLFVNCFYDLCLLIRVNSTFISFFSYVYVDANVYI